MINFEAASHHRRRRYLDVKMTTKIGEHGSKHGGPGMTLTVTIGRIERSPDGMFRYFQPGANELKPTLVDHDLKTLKKRIKAYRKC